MEKESQGKVIIQCLPNYGGLFHYAVFLFNSKDEAVYRGTTSDEGIVEVPVHAGDEYEVMVKAPECMCPKAVSRWVELAPRGTCGLNFLFSTDPFIPDSHNVSFYFTDRNYVGLPISKGELYLCQGLM